LLVATRNWHASGGLRDQGERRGFPRPLNNPLTPSPAGDTPDPRKGYMFLFGDLFSYFAPAPTSAARDGACRLSFVGAGHAPPSCWSHNGLFQRRCRGRIHPARRNSLQRPNSHAQHRTEKLHCRLQRAVRNGTHAAQGFLARDHKGGEAVHAAAQVRIEPGIRGEGA